MNIDFAEFDKIPALRAKRDALDKAVEAESEIIQVAFRQNRNEARAIIDRIDEVHDKIGGCSKRLARYEKPRWYESSITYIIIGAVIFTLGIIDRGLGIQGAILILFGVGLYFRNLIKLNESSREYDDANRAYKALEFRWRSLGNHSTIYFCIFHDESKRLNALRPIPDREANLEVWSYIANEWLNAERNILNELTQRHSPYGSDWKSELDESQEGYLGRIKTLNVRFQEIPVSA